MPKTVKISPDKVAKITVRKNRKSRVLRRVLYALIFLTVILLIAAWAVWINRNLVMEEAFRRYLSGQGFESVLVIDEVTDTQAVIRNVELWHEGQKVFTADKITTQYEWPDVKSGVILSLDVDKPNLALKLGKDGRVLNAWAPEPSGKAGPQFPENGIRLNDFKAALETPYGNLNLSGDLDANAPQDASLNLALEPTELTLNQSRFVLGGQGASITAVQRGDLLTVQSGLITFESVESAGLVLAPVTGETANLTFDGALSRSGEGDAFVYEGRADFSAFDAEHETAHIENGALSFKGIAAYNIANKDVTLDADLGVLAQAFETRRKGASQTPSSYIKASQASLSYSGLMSTNPDSSGERLNGAIDVTARRIGFAKLADARGFAETISLHKTLSKTPLAQQFHQGFTDQLEHVLTGATLDASLDVMQGKAGHRVKLRRPLLLSALGSSPLPLPLRLAAEGQALAGSKIIISSALGKPLHEFDAKRGALELAADISISGPQDLTLSGLSVAGASMTGTGWSQVKRVSGRVVSDMGWSSGAARLGPFGAEINFSNGRNSEIALSSDIDYDGELLGSYFKGLRASGDLSVHSEGEERAITFKARAPITAQSVQTNYGWDAKNVSLELAQDSPILTQVTGPLASRNISLNVSDLNAQILNDEKNQSFEVVARQAEIKGAEDKSFESWAVKFIGVDITSQTTPGPNSHVKSETLNIGLTRDITPNPLQWGYTLSSPAINANLAQLRLRGLGLDLKGSDGDFTVDYSAGTARIDGVDLPNLPMTGQANYVDGALTGDAKTAMPSAPLYPIYARYFYEDGAGGADLDIPEFIFTPNGIQPADLAPVFRGKVAEVSGLASANVKLGYRVGERPTSSGTVTLKDMDIGTLVGPFSGVNTTLNFDSLVPLHSVGTQTITMTGFNAGLPLGAGEISFDVVENGIAIRAAQWPLASGRIYIAPTTWSTSSDVNRIVVHVEDVSLKDMVSQLGKENLQITGQVNGTLPIFVDGVKVLVENGHLSVEKGGLISVQTEGLDAAGASNDTAKIAIDALKEFEYKELSLDINGPLDGNMLVGAVFEGKNKDVLGGADFLFRVNIEGELVNIAKSFSKNVEVDEFLRLLDEDMR